MKLLLLAAFVLGQSLEYPKPNIREEQRVMVNGVTETWRLQWKTTPHPECDAGAMAMAITCPCQGFAYGEAGALDVVRLRNGSEMDRFSIGNSVIVQHWKPADKDFEAADNPGFAAAVAQRPPVRLMNFADYDHDGQKTEFYLPTEYQACGHTTGIIIGISKNNMRLHEFGTAAKPNQPLSLQRHEWDALSRASGPIEMIDWPCGDHGAENETTMRLGWTAAGITVDTRQWTCPGGFKSGKLIPK